MLLYGITPVLYKLASSYADSLTVTFLTTLFMLFFLALMWFYQTPSKSVSRQVIPYVGVAGLIASMAFLFYIRAISSGKVSIVKPIVGLSTAVTVLLGIFMLQERITLIKAAGIILAMISIILLSW
jgi:transporter family protein